MGSTDPRYPPLFLPGARKLGEGARAVRNFLGSVDPTRGQLTPPPMWAHVGQIGVCRPHLGRLTPMGSRVPTWGQLTPARPDKNHA